MEKTHEAKVACEIVKVLHDNKCTVAEASYLLDYSKRLIDSTATVRMADSLFDEAVSGTTSII